jgi:hypothetical protein
MSAVSFSQVYDKDECETVLRMKQIGKEFSFNKSKAGNHDSLVLVYLGEIKTKKGDELKIMTSRWYWGLSPRATTRVIVFNAKNKRLGSYYLSMTYDVPKKIDGSSVVFINDKVSDCTPGLVTKVDFADGIPKEFFLRCEGELGEIYRFDPDNL